MVVHSSLRALLRNPKAAKARSLLQRFSASAIPFSFHHPLNPSSSGLRLTSSHSKIFTPWSRWIAFSGPLFLSAPAYMLSQSATPLYWPGEVVFQKPQSLNLLQKRNLPIKLVFGSNPVLEHAVQEKELGGNGKTSSATVGDATDGFWNLPNLISISRLVSGPFLGWMIINEWYFPAFVGLAISGATDWLDGFVARKMCINSVVGSYLDPLADKVLIGCVAIGMMKRDLLHPGLVGLVLLRDVALVSGAFYQRAARLHWEWKSWSEFFNLDATRQKKVEPLFISKVNTVFQLVLVAAALLQPEFGTEETQPYITYLSWLVASTTGASWAAYGKQHMLKGLATGRQVFVSSNKP